ncbi:uncharacterized protein EAE98_012440 [Botrytis deweyae]|uniref:Uncharacterized protein n=1 Tax=Botrytis deweyae TaxID=2478750 RepID=A0ABQ7I368_9HELO|nr:uncharacterized protein EAE98_012440 [Botrytis deweyae]KAF7908882.1 hypothetical protein EAE98_012440 [Botrytis deweyae]
MGIPYSKQIHSAFDQSQIMMRRLQTEVTPLVAAGYPLVASGFEVLKTTKNIAILLAVVQVYTAIMLTVIFGVGCMLLVTMNPDLEDERSRMVSPVVRGGVEWVERWGAWVNWGVKFGIVCGVAGMGVGIWKGERAGEMEREMVVEGENEETGSEDKEEEDEGDAKNRVNDMDDVGK